MKNWKKYLFHKNTIWILLGALSVLVRADSSPEAIEQYYSRGFFIFVRKLFSLATGNLPFAAVYILFFLLVIILAKRIFRFIKSRLCWQKKLLKTAYSTLAFIGGVVFFFLILWGYNYGRIPLEEQIGISPNPLDVNDLREELDFATEEMLKYRAMLEGVGDSALGTAYLPKDLERTMLTLVTQQFNKFGYPTMANVRGRLLFPDGLLLRISTAGVYIPFTGEGHVDPGLHHLQLPFVLAHELSHGYGIGGEGTCNFLAFLACIDSGDPYLKYVGYLYYWRYVAPDFKAYKPEEYQVIWNELHPGIKRDLKGISEQMAKYPDIFPAIRDAAYNSYLKAQGIDDGIKNYDRVTMLVRAWRMHMASNFD